MTNPKPSLLQCVVLHGIADGEVTFEGEVTSAGRWLMRESFGCRTVTRQVEKLALESYIRIFVRDGTLVPELTDDGRAVVRRRPLVELLEGLNRR